MQNEVGGGFLIQVAETNMQSLDKADTATFREVRYVLTDMDETLTYQGRLSAETYTALENLQNAGIKVIPVTAAPAGWCHQMARMWPVDGVIGENGGFFFCRSSNAHEVERHFWHAAEERPAKAAQLAKIGKQVMQAVPTAVFAEDQPFRLTSLAFAQPHDRAERDLILDALRSEAANVTVNNLWVLGWVGGYDKLSDPAFCVQIFREPKCRAGRHSRGTGLEAAASQYYLQTTEAVQFLPSCFGPTGSTPPLKAAGHLSKPGAPPPAPGFFVRRAACRDKVLF
jgi:hypothetical protein